MRKLEWQYHFPHVASETKNRYRDIAIAQPYSRKCTKDSTGTNPNN